MTWPGMSRDVNPIENLWGILKRKVEHHNPFRKEWLHISPEMCATMVFSMSSQINVDIRNIEKIKGFNLSSKRCVNFCYIELCDYCEIISFLII